MAKLNMVEAINLTLREEMERDDRVVVLGEDVGRGRNPSVWWANWRKHLKRSLQLQQRLNQLNQHWSVNMLWPKSWV